MTHTREEIRLHPRSCQCLVAGHRQFVSLLTHLLLDDAITGLKLARSQILGPRERHQQQRDAETQYRSDQHQAGVDTAPTQILDRHQARREVIEAHRAILAQGVHHPSVTIAGGRFARIYKLPTSNTLGHRVERNAHAWVDGLRADHAG